jgi:hypothetical protein
MASCAAAAAAAAAAAEEEEEEEELTDNEYLYSAHAHGALSTHLNV